MNEERLADNCSLTLSGILRIDQVCLRFEAAWQAGQTPRVEDHLGNAEGMEFAALLQQLILLEIAYRRASGETPQALDYLDRFPDLNRAWLEGALLIEYQRNRGAGMSILPIRSSDAPSGFNAHGTVAEPSIDRTIAHDRVPAAVDLRVPGYEILEELGRGGMGVVYKARHLALDRDVALKMIRDGALAGTEELTRFRTEAQALARLQHPNIVQVHEVGDLGGRPYFSLEYCSGGSLDKKLNGAPLSPKEAAGLVNVLARAIHAAHLQNIVHRDLKPANVLLAANATAKITDFGLAKKLDASVKTQTGAVMGTPSYMAPEQAGGKTKELGRACDVYALGAILYECLTGRPPFKAATVMETLQQVIADEVVPPTHWQSKTPRDLETICLKCLQKEPGRRYATAADLADDLVRFLEGLPVVARPVGPLMRAAKWVRRKPALATGAAVLLVGAPAIIWLAIIAWHQTDKALTNEKTSNRSANDLKTAKQELAQTTDSLDATQARGLLRPLGMQGADQCLNESEWEALWELATHRRGRLGYRFIEEASRTPAGSRQLRNRASLALPAAVGLDVEQRVAVEALLMARLDDADLGDEQKTDLALAASAWDGLSSAGAGRVAGQLLSAMKDTKDPAALRVLAQGLTAMVDRMETKDARSASAQAAASLVHFMIDTKDPDALQWQAEMLSTLATRMDREDASAATGLAAATLLQGMTGTKDPGPLSSMAHSLSAMVIHMQAKDASSTVAQAAMILVLAAKDSQEPNNLPRLSAVARTPPKVVIHLPGEVRGDVFVVGRLEAKEAAQLAYAIVQAINDSKKPRTLAWLTESLLAVVPQMEAKDAAQHATTIVQIMKNTKDSDALASLAFGLYVVAARMEPQDAAALTAPGATSLLQVMRDTKDPFALDSLAHGLYAVAFRMEPRDAASVIAQGADIILQIMKDTKDPMALDSLAQGLSIIAPRMDAKTAATVSSQAATTLLQVLQQTKEPGGLSSLALDLRTVSPWMEAKDAAIISTQAATTLVQAMKDTKNPDALFFLAEGLSKLAACMDSKDECTANTQAFAILVGVMQDTKDNKTLYELGWNLNRAAARHEVKDARAVTILVQLIKDTKDPEALFLLGRALAAVGASMECEDAAQAAVILVRVMKETKDPKALSSLAQSLSVVATRIEARDAANASAQAAILLLKMDPGDSRSLADGLSAVSARLDPDCAQQIASALLPVMADIKDPDILSALAQSLSALLSAVPPTELSSPSAKAVSAVGLPAGASHALMAMGLLIPAAEALPCRLSTQQLVELLKMPTCSSEARRVILDQLANRYQRSFAGAWEFVRFAMEQNLDLDFTSPPQRPEPDAAAAKP